MIQRALLLVVVAVSFVGCGGGRVNTVKRSYGSQFRCPQRDIDVVRVGSGYDVRGCGYRAHCSGNGECFEPIEVLMARARDTFAGETQCPVPSVNVFMTPEGAAAQGCGRYAVCPGSASACFTRQPPTCAELAQSTYNACVASVRDEGNERRPRYGSTTYYVAATVTSTVLEGKGMNQCRANYDTQMQRCQSGY